METVAEPINTGFESFAGPTVPTAERGIEPAVTKHNFTEAFVCPEFTATSKYPKVKKRTKRIVLLRDKIALEKSKRTKGHIKAGFRKKNGLSSLSHPADFMYAMFPRENTYKDQVMCTSKVTEWTNKKAILANVGPGGTCYCHWVPFLVE